MDTDLTAETSVPLTSNALREISGGELVHKIMTTPELKCSKCKNFLYSPIYQLEGVGSICGFCADADTTTCGIRNSAVEAILQTMPISCPYIGRGCREALTTSNVRKHFPVCNYRDYPCPLKVFQACIWEGCLNELLEHSLEDHPNFVIRGFGNCFKLEINLESCDSCIKLLCWKDEKFMFYVKYDTEKAKLKFLMYYIGDKNKVADLTYILQTNSENKDDLLNLVVLHETEFTKDFDETRALTVDMTEAKEFLENKLLIGTLVPLSKISTNKQLSKYLKCTVCQNRISPPIVECLSGHSMCSSCKVYSQFCVLCGDAFASTTDLQYPCVYSEQGCPISLPGSTVSMHEDESYLQPFSCPFSNCVWKGAYFALVNHLNSKHRDSITFSSYRKVFNAEANVDTEHCLIAYGQVFLLRYQSIDDIKTSQWLVHFVGPKTLANKYVYEIGLLDSRCKYRKYVSCEVCESLCDHPSTSSAICIPHAITSSFSNKRNFTYYCNVLKSLS